MDDEFIMSAGEEMEKEEEVKAEYSFRLDESREEESI